MLKLLYFLFTCFYSCVSLTRRAFVKILRTANQEKAPCNPPEPKMGMAVDLLKPSLPYIGYRAIFGRCKSNGMTVRRWGS